MNCTAFALLSASWTMHEIESDLPEGEVRTRKNSAFDDLKPFSKRYKQRPQGFGGKKDI